MSFRFDKQCFRVGANRAIITEWRECYVLSICFVEKFSDGGATLLRVVLECL